MVYMLVGMHGSLVAGAAIGPAVAGGAWLGSLAPRRSAWCKIAMGVTMGYMLILMV